ncbi:Pollen-specific protein C13 [Dichanthelium oligosanthes]|uniref:Pollen-specific protein C13 n=1 Tax=Dichanthelium oligosanthes TaxID=888268 RepID=A0A1E5VHE1_9POAL|nr:Pollen-specific protein C13 [Dichanthelium oligosanthes]
MMVRWSSAVLFAAVVAAAANSGVLVAAVRQDDFFVEGSVYCDTCRAGFETNATTPITGAKVRLECRRYMSASGAVERSAEGATDAAGRYRIELVDNRGAEEVCVVALVSSPVPGCGEKELGRDRAPVDMLKDAGLATTVRRANPLGFLKDKPLPNCGHILSSYALGSAPSY